MGFVLVVLGLGLVAVFFSGWVFFFFLEGRKRYSNEKHILKTHSKDVHFHQFSTTEFWWFSV